MALFIQQKGLCYFKWLLNGGEFKDINPLIVWIGYVLPVTQLLLSVNNLLVSPFSLRWEMRMKIVLHECTTIEILLIPSQKTNRMLKVNAIPLSFVWSGIEGGKGYFSNYSYFAHHFVCHQILRWISVLISSLPYSQLYHSTVQYTILTYLENLSLRKFFGYTEGGGDWAAERKYVYEFF